MQTPNLVIIIAAVMLSWVVFGNLGIHYYFKKKREIVIDNLSGVDYIMVNNIDTHISGKSRFSVSYQRKKSDVIFYENNIIVLLFNSTKLFKQYQPSLQYSLTESEKKIGGISAQIKAVSLVREENKIILSHKYRGGIAKGKMTTELAFPTNEVNLNEILNENNYSV